jgi:hypothetical protein
LLQLLTEEERVIEIEEPPTIVGCSECSSVLGWLYSAKKRIWISVVRVDDETFRLHTCPVFGQSKSWRHVQKVSPDTTRRGIRRARMALKKSITEKEQP